MLAAEQQPDPSGKMALPSDAGAPASSPWAAAATAARRAAETIRRGAGGAAAQVQQVLISPAVVPQQTFWQKYKWLLIGGGGLGVAGLVVGVSLLRKRG